MWDLLKEGLSGVRDGTLSPFTLLAVAFFGVIVWLAKKSGEAVIAGVSNLLSEGKNLRATLNEELERAHARVAEFQAERDEAMRKLGESQVELARCQVQLEAANRTSAKLGQDLMDTLRQLQDERIRSTRSG